MRPVGPSVPESNEAERLCAEYNVKLREWAALLIRCVDCDSLLATVTWIHGSRWPRRGGKATGSTGKAHPALLGMQLG
jgi:hypothetical protein